MSFTVVLHPKAARSLKKLQTSIRTRILESMKELAQSPGKGDHLKPSQFWRLRVGDYRVIYAFVGEGILVLRVRHRGKAY